VSDLFANVREQQEALRAELEEIQRLQAGAGNDPTLRSEVLRRLDASLKKQSEIHSLWHKAFQEIFKKTPSPSANDTESQTKSATGN
jgi:hypothetical protein